MKPKDRQVFLKGVESIAKEFFENEADQSQKSLQAFSMTDTDIFDSFMGIFKRNWANRINNVSGFSHSINYLWDITDKRLKSDIERHVMLGFMSAVEMRV